jgi:hypothetical protein
MEAAMKRFLVSILSVSVFFIGLGTLVEKAGASFRSDERALELIRAARQAIGGDGAINAVKSMTITGQTSHTFRLNGSERTEQGETEIAFELPNRMMKRMTLGHPTPGEPGEKIFDKRIAVIGDGEVATFKDGDRVPGDGMKRIVIRNPDGTTTELKGRDEKTLVRTGEGEPGADGKRIMIRRNAEGGGETRDSGIFRTTLSLLLSTPAGLDVNYLFAGESTVDGTPCHIVEAQVEGSSVKLYLSKDNNLPVMMSFVGRDMPQMMRLEKKADGSEPKDTVIFSKKIEAPENAEIQVRFSDYRSVGGLQLPFRWVQSVNGSTNDTFEVANYEINPSNIGEKFQDRKLYFKTSKD